MITVQLQDFEAHRGRLFNYALALLRSRGSANTLYVEYDEKAKDIVQECYLAFHNSRLDVFVSDYHLSSYLKICLYRKYQESIDSRRRVNQYNISKDIKDDNFNTVLEVEDDKIEYDNIIDKFIGTLTDKQKFLVENLLEGVKQIEIAEDLNISKQMVNISLNEIRNKYMKFARNNKK